MWVWYFYSALGTSTAAESVLTERLSVLGTSAQRLTLMGTSAERAATVGTGVERITTEGVS